MRRSGQVLLAALCLMLCGWAGADSGSTMDPLANDPLAGIPVVSFVTQRFFLTGNFQIKLTRQEMRIDHMADRSSCPMSKRTCHVSLAYSTPIMGEMGTGLFELPILGATGVDSHWTMASFGDYIAYFSDTTTYSSDVRIMATLRFW